MSRGKKYRPEVVIPKFRKAEVLYVLPQPLHFVPAAPALSEVAEEMALES